VYNHQEPEAPLGNVISTNPIVNLTATLASLTLLAGLFLCFADQRSRTIRRYAVQSVSLGVLWLGSIMLLWILAAIFSWIPWIGTPLAWAMLVIGIVGTAINLFLRVRMMFSAYRGVAYVLPLVGESLRRFE